MPRNQKPTPREVLRNFIEEIDALEGGYDDVLAALTASSIKSSVKSLSAGQFATSVVVLWEAFIHDLFVSYVLRHHKKYFKDLKKKILKQVNDAFGLECSKKIVFAFGTPGAVGDIEPLLDPKGWNIVAKTGDKLSTKANELLKSSIAIKFSLDDEDRQFIDLITALRNYLAHRSVGSRKTLISIIQELDQNGKNEGLFAPSINLDRYLLQEHNGVSRIKLIFTRIEQIANQFV